VIFFARLLNTEKGERLGSGLLLEGRQYVTLPPLAKKAARSLSISSNLRKIHMNFDQQRDHHNAQQDT